MDLHGYSIPTPKRNVSELQAAVNEIVKVIPLTKKYGYGYWCAMAKGLSFGEVLGAIKELENLPEKFNKGAVLTNKLCKRTSK